MLDLLRVNPNSGEPIYRQLQEQVIRLIVGGQIAPGDTLPSVRQMADYLKVNPMTVSRAVQNLVEQGYLERRRGQPTQVAKREQSDQGQGVELLTPEAEALIQQAKQLGLDLSALLALIKSSWTKS